MDAVVIAFASGKGGTGKSTTSVFTGAALGSFGKKVLLIELDSGLRSVDIIAGVSGQTVFDVEDVLSGRSEPDRAVVQSPSCEGLSVISAPYSGGEVTAAALRMLCEKMRSHFDFILLDTAAGLGTPLTAAAACCHRMFLVLTPDPVALRDGRLLADDMISQPFEMRLLLNRVNPRNILKDGVLRDLDEAIDTVGVRLLGVIPESSAIAKAGATGEPLPYNGQEQAVYTAIARRILREDVPLLIY